MVRRSIETITPEHCAALPGQCGRCGFWEQWEPASIESAFCAGAADKKHWYDHVLAQWGSCGKLVMQGDQALAYCQYAPADFIPQIRYCKLGPISSDAVFLSCLYVPVDYRGRGLGKLLVNAVQKDLIKRGYRAIETFARRAPAKNPSGWTEFYMANGWHVIKESTSMTLLRLDLRATVTWQINLESVLEGLQIPVAGKVQAPLTPTIDF